jgi:transposase
MARKRIQLKQIRKILQLKHEAGLSIRDTAKLSGASKTTVSDYLARFNRSGIAYEHSKSLSDEDLLGLLEERKQQDCEQYNKLTALFPEYCRLLKKTGFTKQFLWEKYLKLYPDGYRYSQFCHHFDIFQKSGELTMRQPHDPGDMVYIDYTGQKLSYHYKGKEVPVEVYVAILGASQLTFAEASVSQQKEEFVRSTERALKYFGGVPRALVPDNLKSAVTKASKYEPELNPLFDDFAEYYRTTIIPARAYRPKDKALGENAVQLTYQRIFAPLYGKRFNSLSELNQAIAEHLEKHNNRKLSKLQISRRELFNEIEKEELKMLPSEPYPLKYFETHKVAADYHIILSADKHYYSVPWQLKGKRVKVIYDERNVAVYFEGRREAQHRRDRKIGTYTTSASHMPSTHRFYHSWSGEKFREWAGNLGPEVLSAVNHLLESKQHEQQAYKSCMGVLSLAKKNNTEDLNHACRKALNYGRVSYREIKLYLDDIVRQRKIDCRDVNVVHLDPHENLRNSIIYK